MAAIAANRTELLQIADAVARDKSIDKSVVLRAGGDGARYRLLDPIRSFGAARLADPGALRDRHLAYFLALAEHFDSHYLDSQLEQYRALRRAHPDLRAALAYAFGADDHRQAAQLRIAQQLHRCIKSIHIEMGDASDRPGRGSIHA